MHVCKRRECMVSNITFKPQISLAQNDMRQSKVVSFESKLEGLAKEVKKGKISDIGAMTKKTALESNLHEAAAKPVRLVEDSSPKVSDIKKSDRVSTVTDPRIDRTIKAIQNGQSLSRSEQSQILTGQMKQMAVYNQVLHGLV